MAKIQKKVKKQSTLHTRAARRASSPNPDKALEPTTTTRTSPPPISKPHILAAHPSGITKKSKTKQLKRQQRLRHQKGIERAEHVIDKMEMKVGKSVGKEKKVKERKKGWEEVNVLGAGGRKKNGNVFGALEGGEEEEWASEEDMEGDLVVPEMSREVKEVEVVPESFPLPVAIGDEAL